MTSTFLAVILLSLRASSLKLAIGSSGKQEPLILTSSPGDAFWGDQKELFDDMEEHAEEFIDVNEAQGYGGGVGSASTVVTGGALSTAASNKILSVINGNGGSSGLDADNTQNSDLPVVNTQGNPIPGKTAKIGVRQLPTSITTTDLTITTFENGAPPAAKKKAKMTLPSATFNAMTPRLRACTAATFGAGVAFTTSIVVTAPSVVRDEGADFEFMVCSRATNACSKCAITTGQMGSGVVIEIPCGARGCEQCKWFKPNGELSLSGVSDVPGGPTGFKKCRFTHASTGTTGSRARATGDPKATNLNGQNFEILQLGTFSLLSVSELKAKEHATRLTLDATIDRAGENCGATYIKNISMTGSWIQEDAQSTRVRVRAAEGVEKLKSLQVAFNDDWLEAPVIKGRSKIIEKSSNKEVHFKLRGVSIGIKIDAHRIVAHGVKTGKFANFLNVNVEGLQGLDTKMSLGGLLAYDDHSFATRMPEECNKNKHAHFKQLNTSIPSTESFYDDDARFLSNVDVL